VDAAVTSDIAVTVGDSNGPSSSNTAAIAGGVGGALAAVAIAAGVFLFLRRRRQQREKAGALASVSPGQQSLPAELKANHTAVELKAPLQTQAYQYQPPVEIYMEPHVDPPVELSAGVAHARGFHEAPAYR
jgi:hypothetical protein